ncbi:sensor histidine kinase [Natronogracilivirga saccharolytica]|uniref:histidine kinase n=1 Tax=Natronogracilivirga saccharolytica TaxID=2812953 RepID=A0A8J7S7S5_9BACT|nr:sensor histidine kinase [Natronogracilivirga saccharolytica]MBP3191783.1 sensor histidine kinase [Natronogracilivirga saccharolytica]
MAEKTIVTGRLEFLIRSSPFAIAGLYIIISFLWIFFSDAAVLAMFNDPEQITRIQSIKGTFFVLASGFLIFILVWKNNTVMDRAIHDLERSRIMNRKSADEKEVLLSEVHHRVKNNLALISAMLDLNNMHYDDKRINAIIQNYIKRLKSLSLTHELFSYEGSAMHVDFSRSLSQLADLYVSDDEQNMGITLEKNLSSVMLNINQAIPFILLCNELLVKESREGHSPEEDEQETTARGGMVAISLNEKNGHITLNLRDDGPGLLDSHDIFNAESFSHMIAQALVSQLGGSMELDPDKSGTSVSVTFAKKTKKGASSTITGSATIF